MVVYERFLNSKNCFTMLWCYFVSSWVTVWVYSLIKLQAWSSRYGFCSLSCLSKAICIWWIFLSMIAFISSSVMSPTVNYRLSSLFRNDAEALELVAYLFRMWLDVYDIPLGPLIRLFGLLLAIILPILLFIFVPWALWIANYDLFKTLAVSTLGVLPEFVLEAPLWGLTSFSELPPECTVSCTGPNFDLKFLFLSKKNVWACFRCWFFLTVGFDFAKPVVFYF